MSTSMVLAARRQWDFDEDCEDVGDDDVRLPELESWAPIARALVCVPLMRSG
ncbi:MAG TPA: hypothetical protein VG826_20135 [Pirellulales bacterium]|nr:hypothetical protein [Pirellulales bacterium]